MQPLNFVQHVSNNAGEVVFKTIHNTCILHIVKRK